MKLGLIRVYKKFISVACKFELLVCHKAVILPFRVISRRKRCGRYMAKLSLRGKKLLFIYT